MYPSAIQNGCYFRPTYQTSSAQIKMCLQLPQSSSIQKYSIFTIDIRGLYRLGEKTSPWRHFVEFELIWVPGCYPPIAVGGSLPPLDLAWQSAAPGSKLEYTKNRSTGCVPQSQRLWNWVGLYSRDIPGSFLESAAASFTIFKRASSRSPGSPNDPTHAVPQWRAPPAPLNRS